MGEKDEDLLEKYLEGRESIGLPQPTGNLDAVQSYLSAVMDIQAQNFLISGGIGNLLIKHCADR